MRKHQTTEEKLMMIRERLPVLEEKNTKLAEIVDAMINTAFSGAVPLSVALESITVMLRSINLPLHRVGFVMPLPSEVQARINEASEMVAKAFHALYVNDNYLLPLMVRKHRIGEKKDFDDAHDRKWGVMDAFVGEQCAKVERNLEKAYREGIWDGNAPIEYARSRLNIMEGDHFHEE